MLKITHLDHIAMAAPSAPEQLKLLEKLLGFKPLYEFEGLRTAVAPWVSVTESGQSLTDVTLD